MQTSFMHPPFGFALFFLRSVAPRDVKTGDIYWGAVPFVCIQLLMVGLIIAFPGLVSVNGSSDMKELLDLNINMEGMGGIADQPDHPDNGELPPLVFPVDGNIGLR
jgi:hypothetical protein